MYAIIQDGGHQYRVEQGQRLQVELKAAPSGQEITFDKVCFLAGEGETRVGTPFLEGALVTARVLQPELKGKKIDIYFYRRRKNSSRRAGHRQRHTLVEITGITA